MMKGTIMDKKNSDNKKFFSKGTIRATIIGTILAIIFEKLLNPICEFLFSIFLSIGGSFIKYISNMTYRNISDGFAEKDSLFLMYVVVVSFGTLAGYATSKLKERRNAIIQGIEALEGSLKAFNDEHSESSYNDSKVIHKTKEINVKNEIQKISDEKMTVKRAYLILSSLFYIVAAFLLFLYAQHSYSNAIITKTTNNIEIVSPCISDLEYKQLKSDFHTLESADDYNKLQEKLQTIAENNDIKLKK